MIPTWLMVALSSSDWFVRITDWLMIHNNELVKNMALKIFDRVNLKDILVLNLQKAEFSRWNKHHHSIEETRNGSNGYIWKARTDKMWSKRNVLHKIFFFFRSNTYNNNKNNKLIYFCFIVQLRVNPLTLKL